MRRGTIVLGLFVLVAVGIIAASTFLQNQPPITITVAVSPLIADWARESAAAFNASNVRTANGRLGQVNITTVEDLSVWSEREWSAQSHPDAWIPAVSFSVDYAIANGLRLEEMQPSVAKTLLVIAGFESRIDVLTDNGSTDLTWDIIADITQKERWDAVGGRADWEFIDLALAIPDETMYGLAVMFSGAAAYHETIAVDSDRLQDTVFRAWLEPVIRSVPNYAQVGTDVAEFLARRGLSAADIAFAPENQWIAHLNNLAQQEPIRFSYPDYPFVFDFPFVRWQDDQALPETAYIINAFSSYLVSDSRQDALLAFGFRPANRAVTAEDAVFFQAQQYGIRFDPQLDPAIQLPRGAADTLGFLRWVENARR